MRSMGTQIWICMTIFWTGKGTVPGISGPMDNLLSVHSALEVWLVRNGPRGRRNTQMECTWFRISTIPKGIIRATLPGGHTGELMWRRSARVEFHTCELCADFSCRGDIVDGTFFWESAWPKVGATTDGSVALDNIVAAVSLKQNTSYMARKFYLPHIYF